MIIPDSSPLVNNNVPPINKNPKRKAPAPTDAPTNMAVFLLCCFVCSGTSSISSSSESDSTGVLRLIWAKLCFNRDPILCDR